LAEFISSTNPNRTVVATGLLGGAGGHDGTGGGGCGAARVVRGTGVGAGPVFRGAGRRAERIEPFPAADSPVPGGVDRCQCEETVMAPNLFITGTDTGVGKTHVTALLLRELRRRAVRAAAFKPIAA